MPARRVRPQKSAVNKSCSSASNGTGKQQRTSYPRYDPSPHRERPKLIRSKFAFPSLIVSACALFLTSSLSAQVTHGQKPKLPAPCETKSAGNGPEGVKPPEGFLPTVPAGFRVNVYAAKFKYPRWLTVAPNGDIFLADTGAGQVVVLRDPNHTGAAQQRDVFVDGMRRPFGIAFHEDYVYVGNTNELVRFKYDPKTSKR